jgi:hypothetical protein
MASRLDLGRRSPTWLFAAFLVVGFLITSVVSLVAIIPGYGMVVAAVLVLVAAPALVLSLQAVPQAMARVRSIAANWTWWHPLWFLTYFSMLVFRIRDVSAAANQPVDAIAMLRIVPEAFVGLTLIVRLVLHRPEWLSSLFRGIMGALAIYCLVCISSSAWSVNASWTAYKSVEFLADVSLIAAILATAESYITFKNLIDWTLVFYTISLIGVWINIPIWPNEAFDGGRLTGVFPVEASNSVGTSGAVLCLVSLCRLMPLSGKARARSLYILTFLFGMASMLLSQTRGAEAAFVLGVALIILFSAPIRRVVLITGAITAPFIAASVILSTRMWQKGAESAVSFLERDQSQGAIDTLSGRTAWWAYGLEQLAKHPFTGLGAYAAGRFAVLGKLGVGAAAMMHSDWIEIMIGTSFWGVIPFAAALLAAAWYLVRCLRNHAYAVEQRQLALEAISLLSMLAVHSFFNNELSWHAPLLYFAILGFAELIRREGRPGLRAVPAWRS